MALIDFRGWNFKQGNYLPNTQKLLANKDFETLEKVLESNAIALECSSVSDLFFESKDLIAVSAVKNIEAHYQSIDSLLAFKNKEIVDYTEAASEEVFFYGQNSLVAHLESEIALCGINDFSDESLFEEYCEDFELTPFGFDLPNHFLTRDVAMFVENTLLLGIDFIKDKKTRKSLFALLKQQNIEVITFSLEQIEQEVMNMAYANGKLILPKAVQQLLTKTQEQQLEKFDITVVELPFLEKEKVRLRDVIV